MKINIIYNEDCLKGLKKIKDNSVDLIFTSPPYADRRKKRYGGKNESEYNDWFLLIRKELYRILKEDGSFFLNIKNHTNNSERVLYVMELVLRLKKEINFRFVDEFVWTKNGVPGRFPNRFKNRFEPVYHFSKSKNIKFNPYNVGTPMKEVSKKRMNRKRSGVRKNGSGFCGMRYNDNFKNKELALPSNHLHIVQKSNQYTIQSKHPAVFPIELSDFFVKAFTNEDDIVLDPFMGSGTTAISRIKNKRNYIGFEWNSVNNEYHDLCLKRIEKFKEENEDI